MKIECWVIGKNNERYLEEGIAIYQKRLRHYIPFELRVFPHVKNGGKLQPNQLKEKEAELILKQLKREDFLILLDERGKHPSSEAFAEWIEGALQLSNKRIVFLVGGAFGFSGALYERAQLKLSLSKMTFSHQMVRLFFVEQLYRAMTILRNEPYHNS